MKKNINSNLGEDNNGRLLNSIKNSLSTDEELSRFVSIKFQQKSFTRRCFKSIFHRLSYLKFETLSLCCSEILFVAILRKFVNLPSLARNFAIFDRTLISKLTIIIWFLLNIVSLPVTYRSWAKKSLFWKH